MEFTTSREQNHSVSNPHEAFPTPSSAALHPQLWANLAKLGWPLNAGKQEPIKTEPEQGLDLSASGTKPLSGTASSTMETLFRHQREQLLARAAMSTDPTANLDPNSAAAAFAIAAVAAAAAQQSKQSSSSSATLSNLPHPSSSQASTPQMPFQTSSNLPYFPAQNKANSQATTDNSLHPNKRQRLSSPEPNLASQREQSHISTTGRGEGHGQANHVKK
jgi:hypothetical protein